MTKTEDQRPLQCELLICCFSSVSKTNTTSHRVVQVSDLNVFHHFVFLPCMISAWSANMRFRWLSRAPGPPLRTTLTQWDSVSRSQHQLITQHNSTESKVAKWNSTIINFIIHTGTFAAVVYPLTGSRRRSLLNLHSLLQPWWTVGN